MAASVTRADLGLPAGEPGQHLDHLVLDQRRVDVHDDQVDPPAGQPAGLHRHVDVQVVADRHQLPAQRRGVGCEDLEGQDGHRVVGDPVDPRDVRPARGHARRQGAEVAGR